MVGLRKDIGRIKKGLNVGGRIDERLKDRVRIKEGLNGRGRIKEG